MKAKDFRALLAELGSRASVQHNALILEMKEALLVRRSA